jgi:hypothetical protein
MMSLAQQWQEPEAAASGLPDGAADSQGPVDALFYDNPQLAKEGSRHTLVDAVVLTGFALVATGKTKTIPKRSIPVAPE